MTYKELKECIYQDMLRLNQYSFAHVGEGSGNKLPKLSIFRRINLCSRPELMALLLYRISHFWYSKKYYALANFFYRLNLFLLSVDIMPDSEIGSGCLIIHPASTVIHGYIGRRATLTTRILIMPHFSQGKWSDKPVIGDGVTIGAQTLILGGIVIANGVTIAPYSYIQTSILETDCLVKNDSNAGYVITKNKVKNPI